MDIIKTKSNDSASNKVKRKRNRIPLSCTICRKRKVKCDKTRPHCNQCTKTGVAHLCHYMEQSWAEEAEKELSKEAELKQLKERVKSLKDMLADLQSKNIYRNGNTSENSTSGSPSLTDLPMKIKTEINNILPIEAIERTSLTFGYDTKNKYDNDELDLTRNFDMLHLKNNGTIHLGATHWLAIMKGDPYLKLLWRHIFTMREKLNEWYSKKKDFSKEQISSGQCPINHGSAIKNDSKLKIEQAKINSKLNLATRKLLPTQPDFHAAQKNRYSTNKCPIDYAALTPPGYQGILPKGMPNIKKCPIDHSQFKKGSPDNVMPSRKLDEKIIVNKSIKPKSENDSSLPTFNRLKSKCPVDHNSFIQKDKTPPATMVSDIPLTQRDVMDRLSILLPPEDIILLYLDLFFDCMYPTIPILDEQNFRAQIGRIFYNMPSVSPELTESTRYGTKVKLRFSKSADYCNTGILLIILRLAWLSLPSNSCKTTLGQGTGLSLSSPVNTSSANRMRINSILSKYEPSVEAIELVKKHLIKFDELSSTSNSNVSLTTIQFAIFFKLYLMCCGDLPEVNLTSSPSLGAGQDNESHQVLLSSIIQMAFSCGLHRDPDNFPQLNTFSNSDDTNAISAVTKHNSKLLKNAQNSSERFKHAWRKTWYHIISLDVQQSLSLGTPRILRNLKDISDTKLPSSSKIDYVSDIKELIVVKNYTLFFQIDLCIIATLNHILNISIAKNVRKFELDLLISSLQGLTYGTRNICEVINELMKNGLLSSVEGKVDQLSDEIYTLPSIDEIISLNNSSSSESEQHKRIESGPEFSSNALFLSKHMTIRMLLYLLNYILFTHYEPMGNEDPGTIVLAKQYAQETLNYAMEGYRYCMLFFNTVSSSNKNHSIFNNMDVILAPLFLDIGNRAIQFIVCLILRAKCGPLTGMGDTTILANNNTSNSENESTSSMDEEHNSKTNVSNNINDKIDINVGDRLADMLTDRMILFNNLTKEISGKFQYASRLTKSTGFFISLLSNQKPDLSKTDLNYRANNIPTKAGMSGFFKNMPSLILSGDKDSLKRCPVYQDALGFVNFKPGSLNNTISPLQQDQKQLSMGTKLPPIVAYKPVTFSRETTPVNSSPVESDHKRRKISVEPTVVNDSNETIDGPLTVDATSDDRNIKGNLNMEPLPPLDSIAGDFSILQSVNSTAANTNDDSNGELILGGGLDAINNQLSSGFENIMDSNIQISNQFEDFLLQNSNFNGMRINPSSIVEAVGMNLENTENNGEIDPDDFLPIDNMVIEGLPDFLGSGFTLWE
ncbi:hypothetical protein Kpol_467p1 [Vanderwaltozyma polyspora DSM 70294]|uniref:Zn(2)-C6 fungal-type domain-containing protein n=1 Tax=Vanderwaltozyma polyspora (strain ATCC 22028 / DSM 70294 / BCRC 21397 / CBS 2163 / NBRC 10782 / NRRL Y-8283 / UCD 57-17) TaxID=436907 RepID=A7TQE5_VANPO|nr:uncharacterized protein Kpol_467p1 [Vanderwaltozyma polyspora DSM 70294]EDO15489.1 hypothetical protein Kpol_467p1 [Vanderwaltozyma polyspora DSM 70294]